MTEWDQLLRWHCRDLLDERLRQACAHWIVLTAIGLDPTQQPLPPGLALSTAVAPFRDLDAATGPVVFDLSDGPAPLQLFGLWLAPADAAAPLEVHPLNREQWLFWLVPSRQLHPDRRSIGLKALRRAHGDGLGTAQLAEQLLPWWQRHQGG
ncbi:MAG: hypothetical protein RLZZ533_520 [Cyanobacteriota bacterium]|jgi:hypothetical protein